MSEHRDPEAGAEAGIEGLSTPRAAPLGGRTEGADSVRDEALLDSDRGDVRQTLADWRAGFSWLWDRIGTPVLLALVIGSLIWLVTGWIERNRAIAQEDAWAEVAAATSPGAFEQVALSHDVVPARASALLAAADLLLHEAAETQDADEAREALTKAETLYGQVRQLNVSSIYEINAAEGVAVVQASLGQHDEAIETFDEIAATADDAGLDWWRLRAERQAGLVETMIDGGLPPTRYRPAPEAAAAAEPAPGVDGSEALEAEASTSDPDATVDADADTAPALETVTTPEG